MLEVAPDQVPVGGVRRQLQVAVEQRRGAVELAGFVVQEPQRPDRVAIVRRELDSTFGWS